MSYSTELSAVFIAGFIFASGAEEVEIKAEKAVVITFPSQSQRQYKVLGAPSANGTWTTLKDGIIGTGGEVTIFYKSESDQKLFFKVETSDGPEGQRSLLSLANLDISRKDLSRYDLEGADVRGYNFHESKFDGANLSGANLSEARFSSGSFSNANLSHAIAKRTTFSLVNFAGANLEGITFEGSWLGHADFRTANLKGVKFDGAILTSANFSGQTLTNVSFRASGTKWFVNGGSEALSGVNFSFANLTGADLSRNLAENLNLNGAIISGANFEGSGITGAQFTGRDLRDVFLRGIYTYNGGWGNANLAGNDLSLALFGPHVYLNGVNFEGANLEGATFFLESATPTQAYPPRTIENVNFRNADLRSATLRSIIFSNCDFTGADLSFANVVASSFSGCVGLDPEQPGMQFGPGEPGWNGQPNPPGTILPDGTARVGTNPGVGLAPTTVPARLLLEIADGSRNEQINFTFTGNTFSENVGAKTGTVEYDGRGRIGTLKLVYAPQSWGHYKLVFTSANGGQLYQGGAGWFLVGTFSVPE